MTEEETSRRSASEIFDRAVASGEEEMARPAHNLAFSALASGLGMGLSGLGVALVLSTLGRTAVGGTVAYLAYSIGFVVVILGRQQLFTENTLFPVVATLRNRTLLGRTARLWAVVLAGNVIGTTVFGLLAARSPALPPDALRELALLGSEQAGKPFGSVFWSAVLAGWIIALVAWLVTAGNDTGGQVLVVVLLTSVVGLGGFAHSIAGSAEVLTALFAGATGIEAAVWWHVAAVLGNAVGGVVIVALFNYGQVHRSRSNGRRQVAARR